MTKPVEFDDGVFAVVAPFGFVTDRAGLVAVAGKAIRRLFGVTPGQSILDAFAVQRPQGANLLQLPRNPNATIILRSVRTGMEVKGCLLSTADEERLIFLGSPVVRDLQEFKGHGLQLGDFPPSDATPDLLLSMQMTHTALSDARKLGSELQVALAGAQAATEAKARFLAVMSHEIRTPLNGFGAMIDLLRGSSLTADQHESLATMDLCARSLVILVNDILEFSKLDAGKLKIHRQPEPLRATLSRIVGHFEASARDQGSQLHVELELPSDQHVLLDAHRLRQVLGNLISNAIKFTIRGKVMVRAAYDSAGMLTIDVKDTGVGIPAESVEKLFQPFVQADSSTTRRFGGTGLGLSIARELTRAMGGDVVLMHSDEKGSWFRCTVAAPACAAIETHTDTASAPGPTDTGPSLAGAKVLVVDDDRTNRLIATKVMQRLGVDATVVEDGLAGVAAASAQPFDLILMDLMMPGLSGIEATQRIRSEPGPCRESTILAFSAAALGADRDAALAAGMNGFIEKPARIDTLRTTLQQHLTNRRP